MEDIADYFYDQKVCTVQGSSIAKKYMDTYVSLTSC